MSAYSHRAPQRWDIALFDPPPSTGQCQIWVMRVIGLPGERVSFNPDGGLLINDQSLNPPSEISSIRWQLPDADAPSISHPFTVPPDSYYVLGDNPGRANDSRYWGAVPRKNFSGKLLPK